MRQDKFISRIYDLGWTPCSSSESGLVAHGAIQTYHGFLDIAASKGTLKMLVPTLLIDLAWHTHQLSGDRYRVETTKRVGRLLDHEDKVEEGLLGESNLRCCAVESGFLIEGWV